MRSRSVADASSGIAPARWRLTPFSESPVDIEPVRPLRGAQARRRHYFCPMRLARPNRSDHWRIRLICLRHAFALPLQRGELRLREASVTGRRAIGAEERNYHVALLGPSASAEAAAFRRRLRLRLGQLGDDLASVVGFLNAAETKRRVSRLPLVGVYFGGGAATSDDLE